MSEHVRRPPTFWSAGHANAWLPRLLAPLGNILASVTATRAARPGWRAPVPVICCGNVTVGGSGKTTLALDLGCRLRDLGVAPHFLTRGHGGSAKGPVRVDTQHPARLVGDEALLLAEVAPTWVSRDRAEGARAAVAAGAGAIVMDDGLQNPGLAKDVSLLVVDGVAGFGNGRPVPAGPLRESVASAAARCQAAVWIGDDATAARPMLPPSLPVLRARLCPGAEIAPIAGKRVLAFAGIGRPAKFFDMLEHADVDVVARVGFPDHHRYRPEEVEALIERAAAADLLLVTTPKDAVRLAPPLRAAVTVIGVRLLWERPSEIDAMLRSLLAVPGRDGP